MLKRLFDVIFVTFSIIVLFPVIMSLVIAVKLTSKGPIFYRGVRAGLEGRHFKILKFRTMVPNAENLGGFSTALNDPRFTKIGRFLRRYKLDELPQLFNIFVGNMSLVGPRPQVVYYTEQYKGEEKKILNVRPGLTDYASLYFIDLDATLGNESVDDKYAREIEPLKNKLRLKYVYDQSFFVDLKIIIMTMLSVLGIKRKWNIHT